MNRQSHLPLLGGQRAPWGANFIAPHRVGGLRGRGIILLLLLAASLSAAPVLVEVYQEGTLWIPGNQSGTLDVLILEFSVDTTCIVQVNSGYKVINADISLILDGEKPLPHSHFQIRSESFSYAIQVQPGTHSVTLQFTKSGTGIYPAQCQYSYLQAIIFLPDESSAVVERPPGGTRGLSPLPASIVSRGPWVSAPGATELVDASGRAIEGAITDARVQISTLPVGTYFARNDERTVVKIVKVE